MRPWGCPSLVGCVLGVEPGDAANPPPPHSPLMLNDASSAHSMPKYGRQYSLEHIHGPGPYTVSGGRRRLARGRG